MTSQDSIRAALGVAAVFEASADAERRIGFLAGYLEQSGASGLVLGVSGGVDSTVAGRLASVACARTGRAFTAMRLPYGVQGDEADAAAALAFIEPTETITVDIKPAVDALHRATGSDDAPPEVADFVKGNIKARQRMVAQYAVAGRLGALVVGTDHAAEAVMGFFTKYGDGAFDVGPLLGLTKSRVRDIGRALGAPSHLVDKVPTADLEELRPALPDEVAHGVTYAEIDAYLVGREVSEQARGVIESAYRRTAHKRRLPPGP
ncbi:ammonia-dependent NAD(+) synthetase [Nocardioides carbamazepini]|uniref:ammonia-dependent NAD(+) synthetase n=1 Tax=Nocardioides carbamazepini TaxID=2854259 RepID=UPI002149DB6A|nr:ammonia-dependent NAD(+) synthetase [Nocardioides carbamazepini]MCR1785278.1 ammonia-dependent NAD(+) synthetase [Nocardioides carbamazepini]